MAGEIFISYRRADQAKAALLWRLLHERGVEAWYDQHVPSGEDWRAATANALVAAPIFVLLFSKSAAQSDDIAKELGAATFQKKLVIPVRLEDIHPEGAFLYELASRNWFDAFDDTDARLTVLADRLAALVKGGKDAQDAAIRLGAPGAQKLVAPDRREQNRRDRKERKATKRGVNIYAVGGLIIAGLAIVTPTVRSIFAPKREVAAIAAASQRIAFFGFTPEDNDDSAQKSIAAAATDEGFRNLTARHVELAARGDTSATDSDEVLDRARELGARYALSGDLRRSGDRVIAAMRLEDVATRTALWEGAINADAASPGIAAIQIAQRATDTAYCITSNGYAGDTEKRDDRYLGLAARACDDWVSNKDSGLSGMMRLAREHVRIAPENGTAQARLAVFAVSALRGAPPGAQAGMISAAKAALARAQAIHPDGIATAYALAYVSMANNTPLAEWLPEMTRIIERQPSPDEAFHFAYASRSAAYAIGAAGRTGEALKYLQAAIEIEPSGMMGPMAYRALLAATGDGRGETQLTSTQQRRPAPLSWDIAIASALFLRAGDADQLLASPAADVPRAAVACWRDVQAGLNQASAAARLAAARTAKGCLSGGLLSSGIQAMVALGDLDDAFALAEGMDQHYLITTTDFSPLFFPSTRAMRADPRFLALAEKLGYVDYWKQTKTQPDICVLSDEQDISLCTALRAAN